MSEHSTVLKVAKYLYRKEFETKDYKLGEHEINWYLIDTLFMDDAKEIVKIVHES